MRFSREGVGIFDEARPLLELHWKEVAPFDDIRLDPDMALYARMEEIGTLRVFTARADSGELTGYATYFVHPHLHAKFLCANQDSIFISPKRRGFGMSFIRWCDDELRKEGVGIVYVHTKTRHDFGPMLIRSGYAESERVYQRRFA